MAANVLSAADLALLAHDAVRGVDVPAPLLLLAEVDDDGVSLLVAPPSEAGEPELLDLVLGTVAPAGCDAVALAARGRAWRDDGSAVDVVVSHAQLRSGSAASHVTDCAGAPLAEGAAAEGLVPDLCRRVLGMPTPPPTDQTDEYLGRLWLDRLLTSATARPGALTSAEVVALHPAEQAEVFGRELTWLHLAIATHRFAAAVPWAVLRRRFASSGDDRVARAAGWFDDGSFSRWMLAQLPTAAEALEALEALLPPGVHHEVCATSSLVAELRVDLSDEEHRRWPAGLDDGVHGGLQAP